MHVTRQEPQSPLGLYKTELHLHIHVTHGQRNTHTPPKRRHTEPGERGTASPWTTPAQNGTHHSRTSLLAELRTGVLGKGWRVIQFRFSEDFAVAIQHSVFGRVKGFVGRGWVGKGNCSRQIRLDTDSAIPHNKHVLLTNHRRAGIHSLLSEISKLNAVTTVSLSSGPWIWFHSILQILWLRINVFFLLTEQKETPQLWKHQQSKTLTCTPWSSENII